MYLPFIIIFTAYFTLVFADYYVIISGDTAVVQGGTIRLRSEVFDPAGYPASGSFQYIWRDNAIPEHSATYTTSNHVSYWNVTYDSGTYAPGPYNIQVDVRKKDWLGFWEDLTSSRVAIKITSLLTGEIHVTQGDAVRKQYVATNATAQHNVTLAAPDYKFLMEERPRIVTYWFMDCQYLGMEPGLERDFKYSQVDTTHYIEALVVASAMPPPPPTTTTTTSTTTSTTTTTTPSTTTTSTTTTTVTPPTTTTTATTSPTLPTVVPTQEPDMWSQWLGAFPVYNVTSGPGSGFCINMTTVPSSPNSTYGYFNKKLIAKAPVRVVNINGSNWLQDGDVLNIGLTCNGSGPFHYCVQLANGQYNVTGNETCEKGKAKVLTDCALTFGHLFPLPQQYTLVFIISNSVSRLVTPVGINVYKVTKQPQLSVIVVPVSFTIIAVILIIFGVAYSIQSRRSYTIEVADFDFGQVPSELEYKTFPERLRESVMNSFFRTSEDQEENESAWSPSRKYGSML